MAHTLCSEHGVGWRAAYNWQDDQFIGTKNHPTADVQEAYGKFNASLFLASADGKWRVSLIGTTSMTRTWHRIESWPYDESITGARRNAGNTYDKFHGSRPASRDSGPLQFLDKDIGGLRLLSTRLF